MKQVHNGVNFTLEQAAHENGFTAECGIDEAGRLQARLWQQR